MQISMWTMTLIQFGAIKTTENFPHICRLIDEGPSPLFDTYAYAEVTNITGN